MKKTSRLSLRNFALQAAPLAFVLLGACSLGESSSNTAQIAGSEMPTACQGLKGDEDTNGVNKVLGKNRRVQDTQEQDTPEQDPQKPRERQSLPPEPPPVIALNTEPAAEEPDAVPGSDAAAEPNAGDRAAKVEAQQAMNQRYSACADAHSLQNAKYLHNNEYPTTCNELPGLAACPKVPDDHADKGEEFMMPMPTLGGEPMTKEQIADFLKKNGLQINSAAEMAENLQKLLLEQVSQERAGCRVSGRLKPPVTKSRTRLNKSIFPECESTNSPSTTSGSTTTETPPSSPTSPTN